MLSHTITESLEVSVLKMKGLGREGEEALAMAITEREVKGVRLGHLLLRVSFRPWDTKGD